MWDAIFTRVIGEAYYIVNNKATIRETAKVFQVGKSTLHNDVTVKLQRYDAELAKEVRKVLDVNKAEAHIRGGNVIKEKIRMEQLKKEQL